MNVSDYLKIINLFEAMKRNTRHSWLSDGRHESVAEHSWRLTIMAYFIKDEFPEIDADKLIKMCLFHDIGEVFTGDIPTFLKTEKDDKTETSEVDKFIETLPENYKTELKELFCEMNAMQTTEAKLYKALDKMEAVIQHNEADISTWLPLEYKLQLTYGTEETNFSEYTKKLKKAIDNVTIKKIKTEKQ